MPDHLTAERIIELLGLKPHPTCGFVTETYRAQQRIPDEALPTVYAGSRPFASVLYFMVTADARIRPHRIRSDQMYHYYIGEPLEVLLLYPDGTGEIKVLGADLNGGMRPQLLIPGGTIIRRVWARAVRLQPSPCLPQRNGRDSNPQISN
jgi:predicted cupin superfamily sugar epimerase